MKMFSAQIKFSLRVIAVLLVFVGAMSVAATPASPGNARKGKAISVTLEVQYKTLEGEDYFVVVCHVHNHSSRSRQICILDNWVPLVAQADGQVFAGGLNRDATRSPSAKDLPVIPGHSEHPFRFYCQLERREGKEYLTVGDRFGGTWEVGPVEGERCWLSFLCTDPLQSPLYRRAVRDSLVKPEQLVTEIDPTGWVEFSTRIKPESK